MPVQLTAEQLNSFDKETLITLYLQMQEQLVSIDNKLQLVLEQMSDMNRRRFGSSSEKSESYNQLTFTEIDGELCIFNEAEVLVEEVALEETTTSAKTKKAKGKREADISGLPVTVLNHEMSEEELNNYYPDKNWKRLPDEIYKRYHYVPSKVTIEEHHIAVYSGVKSEKMVKAKHPKKLLNNSLASASIVAGIMNAKYVNALPLYRIEAEFNRHNINISRQTMAN